MIDYSLYFTLLGVVLVISEVPLLAYIVGSRDTKKQFFTVLVMIGVALASITCFSLDFNQQTVDSYYKKCYKDHTWNHRGNHSVKEKIIIQEHCFQFANKREKLND